MGSEMCIRDRERSPPRGAEDFFGTVLFDATRVESHAREHRHAPSARAHRRERSWETTARCPTTCTKCSLGDGEARTVGHEAGVVPVFVLLPQAQNPQGDVSQRHPRRVSAPSRSHRYDLEGARFGRTPDDPRRTCEESPIARASPARRAAARVTFFIQQTRCL